MKKTVRALFVFPLAQVWGGEGVWLKFLSRVDRSKIEPFCLVFGEGPLLKRLDEININYYHLPGSRIRDVFLYLKNLLRTTVFLKKEKFDVVNSLGVNLLTTLAASILNIPCVLHIHTMHRLSPIDRWCLHRTKHIITVSNFTKELLIDYGIRPDFIEVIYNGIDIDEFTKETQDVDIRKEFNIDESVRLICYTGRIVKWKNLDMLVRAVPKIMEYYSGEVKFIFIGETPGEYIKKSDYTEYLLKLAGDLGVKDRVIFAGRRENIAGILKDIDIFVLPSQLEVLSLSILEAMAMSRPVVAIKIGGIPELIGDDAGILTEPGDVDGLAGAVAALLKDKEKRKNIGEAAHLRVKERFSLEDNVKKLECFLENMMLNIDTLKEIIKNNIFSQYTDINIEFIKRRYISVIFKVGLKMLNGQVKTCWVKIYRDFLKRSETAIQSYTSLKILVDGFRKEEKLDVVKPLWFIPDYAAVATEHCEGVILKQMIIKGCSYISRDKDELEEVLFNCGRWLAKFQMIMQPNESFYRDNAGLVLESQSIENNLMCLVRIGVSPSIIEKIRRYFSITTPAIKSGHYRKAVYRSDFGPHNFLVGTKGKIIGLDFDYLDCRDALENVALFMAHLDILLKYPFINPDKIQLLKKRFLEGYQKESGFSVDKDALFFWQARWVVAALSGEYYLTRRRNPFVRRLILGRTARLFEKWVKENIKENISAG